MDKSGSEQPSWLAVCAAAAGGVGFMQVTNEKQTAGGEGGGAWQWTLCHAQEDISTADHLLIGPRLKQETFRR